uniref:Phosphohydrolase n=1 Tax=Thermocrispum agreste TaxID=37925 RepID=A0A2W4JJ58_9PSEU|nr:MAG: phosphohydrolase [Thermocrispum agreste]
MWDSPGFLDLPARPGKPRSAGVTHVLDRGVPVPYLEAVLTQAGDLVDVLKIGWGTAYVDPAAKDRAMLCRSAGITLCLGGTLLEICYAQDKVDQLVEWANGIGVAAVEVSDGLCAIGRDRKAELIRRLSTDFTVLAETGAKDSTVPVVAADWVDEMESDLAAGARWVVVEGRESGTVGLYHPDGSLRTELIEEIQTRLPVDRVIFEAPRKPQQVWLIDHFGPQVNLGNIPLEDALAVETLRLGLRADTARVHR